MAKVSIIVPIYNNEKYLRKCLDSLVNQTFKDIEIIAINDGSTDKTKDILEEYQKKYSKILKVINQENKGIAASRNKGIELAKGDYIAFVDSDDYVDLEMYEKLYNKVTSDNFDIATSFCNYKYDDHVEKGIVDVENDILTEEDLKQYFLKLYPVIVAKLFKKDLLNKINFRDVYAEDVDFLYRILPKVKKVGVVQEHLYYYYQRENSESNVYTERLFDYVYNFNDLYTYYQDNKYFNTLKKEFEFVYVRYLYATFIKRSLTLNNELQKKAYKLAIKNVKEKFPKYRRNKYFYKSLKGIYLVTFNRFYLFLIKLKGGIR